MVDGTGGVESRFGPDGTQPPPPPPVYPDAAAGLGGSRATGFRAVRDAGSEIEIAKPVQPDSEAAREAMREAFADEQPRPPAAPRSGGRATSQRARRQVDDRAAEPTVVSGIGKPKRRQSIGCVLVLVVILAIVLVNVFAGLGDWLGGIFHP